MLANLDIVRQLPGYVTCKNKELIITHANEQMAKAVGFSSVDQNIGRTDYELPCPACELAEEFRSQDRQGFPVNKILSFAIRTILGNPISANKETL